jgi:hypothetical protein
VVLSHVGHRKTTRRGAAERCRGSKRPLERRSDLFNFGQELGGLQPLSF